VHLRRHLATARHLAVLLVDIAVLRQEGEALVVVEGEEAQKTTHTSPPHRIRDRDRQDLDVEDEDGHTLIRGRLQGHHPGGEEAEDHLQGVRQGEGVGVQAIARIAAIAAAGPGPGVDRLAGVAMVGDDR
jgi:hypothetical protein